MKLYIIVFILVVLYSNANSQCDYGIYFKDIEKYIDKVRLNSGDSLISFQRNKHHILVSNWDCKGNCSYRELDQNNLVISQGIYKSVGSKPRLIKIWAASENPPYEPIRVKHYMYFVKRVELKNQLN